MAFLHELCGLDSYFCFVQGRRGDMGHLNDLWSVMVIYFPSARGEVERSIEVNRPEMVLRCDGVSLQSLRESHRHYITLSFLLNHLYRCHHSSDPNLRSFCGIMAAQRPTESVFPKPYHYTLALQSTEIC